MHRERVRFERPVLEEIRNGGFSPVDMHVHTNHSDAPVSVKATLKKASKSGFGLAITDHNAISGYREAQGYESGVLLIPGIEVSARDGPHILIYFYSGADIVEFYEKIIRDNKRKSPCLAIRLDTAEIVSAAQQYHCIVAAAHPYGYLIFNKGLQKCIEGGYLPQDLIGSFQAAEVVCGGMSRQENEKAIRLADRHNLGIVGGTDSHLLFDTGRVLTCSKADTADEFLDNVLRMENFIIGKELRLLEKGFAGTVVLTKYVRYTLPTLAIHYEQNMPRARRFTRKAWTRLKRDR
ncbi:MAG: PHP domain-containing protein [Methanolinea sp.]|nr:PHP domain-containing protein [Methanolinea sp.]